MATAEWAPADRSAAAAYHFLTSAVAPRPIAWITTIDEAGVVNAAPFSWFQSICADPMLLMVAFADRPDGTAKDTLRNLQSTGECVVQVAPGSGAELVVASSAADPPGQSEVERLGLETAESHVVRPPRLKASPVHLECRLVETKRYGDENGTTVAVLEVVWVGADEAVLDARGNVRSEAVRFLARLGGREYLSVGETFEMERA